ncbi:hypothetical protein UFOVP204_108 [uncultured Caudovirales phage]|uniref:Sulfotransferase family n=1 Tax=uncultured Caudovirales phage TaxID=2100421 RepID=A0A6J7WKC8_9CAUD|nr:hypothetical protein UFOVP204_108 [uncultured Caudovirales phage]
MQIYHNHIPRTGGNYVRNALNQKMSDIKQLRIYTRPYGFYFCQLEKKDIEKANLISGHFGLEPEFLLGPENLLSVTTLRDPVMRLVSHFTSNIAVFETLGNFNPNYSATPLQMFQRWIRTDKDMLSKSNMQARFLTNGLNHNLSNVNLVDSLILLQKRDGWGIGTEEPTYEAALSKIDSMFCVGTTEKIDQFLARFDNKIKERIGIDLISTDLNKANAEESTKTLYDSLTEEDIDIIKSLNQIDLRLWEYVTNSYDNA